MTEREKQLKGLPYSTKDAELVGMVRHCQKLCQAYNSLPCDADEERKSLIKEIIHNIGDNYLIEQPFRCDYGTNISIGDNFYANYNLTILDCARITIGDNCLIGPNVGIYAPNHPIDPKERAKGIIESALPITIGNNVWIGGSCTILSGVTIGDNCTIGAGSVVTRDIPPNSVAVGNPARVIKKA